MRFLFATRPFYGHLYPMAGVATELAHRGHEVSVATAEEFRAPVEALGLRLDPAGLDPWAPLPPRVATGDAALPEWAEHPISVKAHDLVSLMSAARPDVVVRDQTDLAAHVAAERMSVPVATLGPAMYIPPVNWRKHVGAGLDLVRAEQGLPPDPGFERLHPALYLDPAPDWYQVPAAMRVTVRHELQPALVPPRPGDAQPDWLAGLNPERTVYLTLGTVYNRRPALVRTVLEGLVGSGLTVVVSTGPGQDPASLHVPDGLDVHVASWLSHAQLLPRCAAVITNGGFGSVMGALWHGLPMAVIPLGSDNPAHANRCASLGVAVTSRPEHVTAELARTLTTQAVTDDAMRARAQGRQRQLHDMPNAAEAADRLEALTGAHPARATTRRRTTSTDRPRTAVVVPVYGRPELTEALLDDISREGWVQAVVVDNSGDHVPSHGERVLRPGQNLGWAGGCNHALEVLRDEPFEGFVLLNNDTRLSPRFFEGLWKAQRTTGAGLVAPVYDGVWPHQHPTAGGTEGGMVDVTADTYQPQSTTRSVPFVDGTCLLVPRRTLEEVGLLDAAGFPCHGWGVDFDYALRVRMSGAEVVVTELSFLHHEGNGTAGLAPEGWRSDAWLELADGMRRKWGVAWPRRLRDDVDSGSDNGGPSTVSCGAVVVVGPPRSGLSSVVRLVNRLGVAPLATSDRQLLDDVAGRLAEAAGLGSWYAPDEPSVVLGSAAVMSALDEARDELRPLRTRRTWLWREPYDGVLLPFWVAALDLTPAVVLVLRDPRQTALSLQARTGCPLDVALARWERRLRHALRNAVGLPVFCLRYDDLVDHPETWAGRLQGFLQEQGVPLLGEGRVREAARVVEPRLRHSRGDAPGEPELSAAQLALYESACALVGSHASFPDLRLTDETATTERLLAAAEVPRGAGPLRLSPEWQEWVRHNRHEGTAEADIAQVLVERGLTPAQVRQALGAVPSDPEPAYRAANRDAWDNLAAAGIEFSQPLEPSQIGNAREQLGAVVPLPWDEIGTVLCLAGGGGQQSLLLASLGLDVTVVDLSATQLDIDRRAAEAAGLEIRCVQADMLDLSPLGDRMFDLVYQPVSTCYVPDLAGVYREVARVVRPGGWYHVEHWNPTQMQLAGLGRAPGPLRLVRPQRGDRPVCYGYSAEEVPVDGAPGIAWHYIHPLEELLGSMCDAGFSMVDLGERRLGDPDAPPGSEDRLDAYAPPLLTVLARRDGVVWS